MSAHDDAAPASQPTEVLAHANNASSDEWSLITGDLPPATTETLTPNGDNKLFDFEPAARLCLILLLALTAIGAVLEFLSAGKRAPTYSECATVAANDARLACYDNVSARLAAGPAKGATPPQLH